MDREQLNGIFESMYAKVGAHIGRVWHGEGLRDLAGRLYPMRLASLVRLESEMDDPKLTLGQIRAKAGKFTTEWIRLVDDCVKARASKGAA